MADIAKEYGTHRAYGVAFGYQLVFQIHVNEEFVNICHHYSQYRPQWPWMLAQMCLHKDTSASVVRQRLGLLISTLHNTLPHSPFAKWQDQFVAPEGEDCFPWVLPRLEQWQKTMKTVMRF